LQSPSVWKADSSALHVVSTPSVTIAWQSGCSAADSDEQQLERPLQPVPSVVGFVSIGGLDVPLPVLGQNVAIEAVQALGSSVTISWQLSLSLPESVSQQADSPLQPVPLLVVVAHW
jgi:hypothetical protein